MSSSTGKLYDTELARIKSFIGVDWFKENNTYIKEFVETGYYYKCKNNEFHKVETFCCGIYTNIPLTEDLDLLCDLWSSHAYCSPNCEFLRKHKSSEFIENAKSFVKRIVEYKRKISSIRWTANVRRVINMRIPANIITEVILNKIESSESDSEVKFESEREFLALCYELLSDKKEDKNPSGLISKSKLHHMKLESTNTEQLTKHIDNFNKEFKELSIRMSKFNTKYDEFNTYSKKYEQDRIHKMCAICMNDDRNIVFLPCAHCICCESCSFQIKTKCSMCKEPISDKIKIFFS